MSQKAAHVKMHSRIRSLESHLHRGNLEKCIVETLEDNELAKETKNLQNLRSAGDALRNQLVLIVSKQHEKLLMRARKEVTK